MNFSSINSIPLKSSRFLISPLFLVPLFFIVILIDLYSGGTFTKFLSPLDLGHSWFYIFHFPHVLMGLMTFFDTEYLKTYKKEFLRPKLIFFIFLYSFIILNPEIYFLIFSFLLGMHISKQQFGLEALLSGTHKVYRKLTDYITTFLFSITFYIIVFPGLFSKYTWVKVFFTENSTWKIISPYLTLLIIIPLFYQTVKRSEYSLTRQGKIYIWGNFLLNIFVLTAFHFKYYKFCAGIPRVVHDLTSFYLYYKHDRNRNKKEIKNFVMKNWLFHPKIPFFTWALLPFGFAFLQGKCFGYVPNFIPGLVFMSFAMFHFYTEGFIWKKGAPHMKNLDLT